MEQKSPSVITYTSETLTATPAQLVERDTSPRFFDSWWKTYSFVHLWTDSSRVSYSHGRKL